MKIRLFHYCMLSYLLLYSLLAEGQNLRVNTDKYEDLVERL
ncbi:MAG: hypothetical protein RLZZ546_120, partial [Bacteroidota bacterium]